MPELNIPGANDLPAPVADSKIEQASATPAPDTEMQQRYNELEKIAQNAVKRAEGAEQFVGQLTASLQEAAARAGTQHSNLNEQPVDMTEQLAANPQAFLDRHFAERAAPLVAGVAENQARMNRELAFNRYKSEKIEGTDKTFADVYGEEVDEFMKNMPATTRSDPGAYDAALGWVRAKHVNDEVKMRYEAKVESEKRAFVEAPSGGSGGHRPTKTLSDVEKQVAKGLGLNEEDYLKYRDVEA